MSDRIVAIRRKPAVKGAANRALMTIPKGTLEKSRQPCGETALSAIPRPVVVCFPGDGRQQERRESPLYGFRREDEPMRSQEIRRRREERQKLCAYLNPLLEALPLGVLIADSENRLQMANAVACGMLFGQACGRADRAVERAGIASKLQGVLQTLAESGSRFFHLREPQPGQLVRVERLSLSAEQGLAADRVYLLQCVAVTHGREPGTQNGASA